MRLLIVVATEKEAQALASQRASVVVSGIGRVNAALAVADFVHAHGVVDAIVNTGIAGSLAGSNLKIGDMVLATQSVYAEEGIQLPDGFAGMEKLGFTLGDFSGNCLDTDRSLDVLALEGAHHGVIATVATCSGSDAFSLEIVRRTGAIAEAMEGAAVLHAARRFKIPATEIRVISNNTGNRNTQRWDLSKAFASLKQLGARIDLYLAKF